MKKYKLLKWYPSLRTTYKVGDIVEKRNTSGYGQNSNVLPLGEVENNPEFWERVNQYEILKLISTKENDIRPNGTIMYFREGSEDLIGNFWEIYSVKRLNDGCIFTIGDKIQNFIEEKEIVNVITKIGFYQDTLWIGVGKISGCLLNSAELNTYLFTSHDGKEIKKGDKVFGLLPKANWQTNYYGGDGIPAEIAISSTWIYFSTKEALETFRDENMPRFSKKDMLDFGVICYARSTISKYSVSDLFSTYVENKL